MEMLVGFREKSSESFFPTFGWLHNDNDTPNDSTTGNDTDTNSDRYQDQESTPQLEERALWALGGNPPSSPSEYDTDT